MVQIIGLCGQSGSGKSTAADAFASLGVHVLDADVIYRELTDAPGPCLNEIVKAFGKRAMTQDGRLNRAFLRDAVFASENAQQKRVLLNSITHKFVKEELVRRIKLLEGEGARIVLLDVPLLFESGIDKLCDFLICVTADLKTRISRIVLRDGISEEQAAQRIRSQIDDGSLISRTHFHIVNDGDICSLNHQIEFIYKQITAKVGF